MKRIGLLFLLSTASLVVRAADNMGFWGKDVWRDPSRPFLYYGEGDRRQPAAANEHREKPLNARRALTELETLDELKAERTRRLNVAVMHPTAENIASYLEVNAFVTEKSAQFAAAWRDALIRHPQWDWTSAHPTVNAASTALLRDDEERTARAAALLGRDRGLILFADAGKLSELMLPIAERFAALYGIELVVARVGAGPRFAADDPLVVKPDVGLHHVAAGGLTQFPALVMIHRDDPDIAHARLIATGVTDVAELARRAVRLAGLDHPAVPRALPSVFSEDVNHEANRLR